MSFKNFTQMHVYEVAMDLLVKVYKETKNFPIEEKFGLISDMRRAANSITHNIAEGFGRFGARNKTRFYKISRGSSYELMSQNYASFQLGFQAKDIVEELNFTCNQIIEELDSLIKSIENPLPKL
jgi:four helix bundle protein